MSTLHYFKRHASHLVPLLLRELTNSYSRVEKASLEAGQDTQSQDALKGIRWKESYFRANAVHSLHELLPQVPELVPQAMAVLLKALDDDQNWVRRPAIDTLGSIGPAAQMAVPRLLQSLKETERDTSRAALHALARIAPDDEQVIRALFATLRADPVSTRADAAKALAACKAFDPVIASLTQALSDTRHEVRRAAPQSLGRITIISTSAREALVQAEKDPFPSVRAAAKLALQSDRKPAPSPIESDPVRP